MESITGGLASLPTPTRSEYSPYPTLPESGVRSGASTVQYTLEGCERMVPLTSNDTHVALAPAVGARAQEQDTPIRQMGLPAAHRIGYMAVRVTKTRLVP